MSVRPAAQHAWEDTFRSDEAGRSLPPRHHRLLMLEVAAAPTAEDARELEAALAALEAAYGHGGEGLLMCLGWGPGWFSRYTAMRSPVAGPVPMARWENPVLEDYDACLHLASDREETVEEALRLLFGPGPLDQRGQAAPGRGAHRLRRRGTAGRAPPEGGHSRGRSAADGLPLGTQEEPGDRGGGVGPRRALRGRYDHARQLHRAGHRQLVRAGRGRAGRADVLAAGDREGGARPGRGRGERPYGAARGGGRSRAGRSRTGDRQGPARGPTRGSTAGTSRHWTTGCRGPISCRCSARWRTSRPPGR